MQETTNNGGEIEKEKEAPLVDVSEPKPTAETESATQEKTTEAEEKKVEGTATTEAKSPEAVDGSEKKEAEQAKTDAPLIAV